MDITTRLLLLSLCVVADSEPLGALFQRRRDAFDVYAGEFARQYQPYMFAAFPLHAPVPVLRVLSRAPLPRTRDAHAAPSTRHAAYARPYEPARFYPQAQHYADHALHYAEPALHYAEPARHYGEPARHYAEPARHYATAAEPAYEASYYSRALARPAYLHKPRRQVPPAYEYGAEYDSYAQPIQPSPLPQLAYAIAPYDSVEYSATQEAAPTVLYARPSPTGGFTYRRVPDATAAPKKAPTVKEAEKDSPFIVKIHKYRIVKDDLI